MSALRAAQAVTDDGAAEVGAVDRPRELAGVALPVKGACGVAARADGVRPWTASLGAPEAPEARWRQEGTSTHGPGSDLGSSDGESGPVSRPGPDPLSTTREQQ